ncbi:hypothetical protein MYSTI_03730 [Myxococcus stipitatus DSM 14675]|uniref:Uncharacterized protein n=1 Tax=Myxococcus stipitatus (strain DSM 14675 / JCM 12634 / Mx s8) TaxID=1278073 RepID=L7U815_MYXSD|nr:hypothetical protein [Myxococcus stipitatus]AGC45036.1 hypothetical protein MYSTI_03730 [Myxococcus stipitatus DSM 14675]
MRRYPLRTLLLMLVALIAFGRLWCVTHQDEKAAAPSSSPRAAAPPVAPAPPALSLDCRALEQALAAPLRTPDDPQVVAEARKRLESCPRPPPRACEMAPALAARAPFSQGADTPLRGLLGALCERCAGAVNACAETVSRAMLEAAIGRPLNIQELQWNLEHAGPGTPSACDAVVRLGLAPAAQADIELPAGVLPLVEGLSPACHRVGLLPPSVLAAAVVQQGDRAPALKALAQTTKPGATSVLKPDQVSGAQSALLAFDGDPGTHVAVASAPQQHRWAADGALRASYSPPLKSVASFRLKAQGPGTLRAIVRTPKGAGLKDPEAGTSFVNPTVCQYQGKGEWETCELSASLTDVEAISVFPARADGKLHELEVRGAR